MLATPLAASADPVEVTKDKMQVQKRIDVFQASSMEKGNTAWFFHCFPNFNFQFETKTEHEVTIRPETATMHIGLDITETVPHRCSDKLQAHEDGHVEICRRAYENAEKIAHDAVASAIGQTFTGKGATEKEATDNAIDIASKFVCAKYSAQTGNLCDKVSETYDAITQHGLADVTEKKAIDQAFKKNRGE